MHIPHPFESVNVTTVGPGDIHWTAAATPSTGQLEPISTSTNEHYFSK
jgi:hypothetical protein